MNFLRQQPITEQVNLCKPIEQNSFNFPSPSCFIDFFLDFLKKIKSKYLKNQHEIRIVQKANTY